MSESLRKAVHLRVLFFCRIVLSYGAISSVLLLRPVISAVQLVSQIIDPQQFATNWETLAIHTDKAYSLVISGISAPNSFTVDEVRHFQDVHVVLLGWGILLLLMFLLSSWMSQSVSVPERRQISQWMTQSIWWLGGGGLLSALFFDQVFLQFHQLFFPQGNFSFSMESLIIQVFPPTYWLLNFVLLQIGAMLLIAWQGSQLPEEEDDDL